MEEKSSSDTNVNQINKDEEKIQSIENKESSQNSQQTSAPKRTLDKIGLGGTSSNNHGEETKVDVLRVVDQKQQYLVDLRDASLFFEYHIDNSCNLPLNDGNMEDRMFELPPRKSFLSLISNDANELSSAYKLLTGASYFISKLVLLINLDSIEEAKKSNSTIIFNSENELNDFLNIANETERREFIGKTSKKDDFQFKFKSKESTRFWKANPFLEQHISEIEHLILKTNEKTLKNENNNNNNNNNDNNSNSNDFESILKSKLRAIDIGCGSGRDVVRLALRGWEVFGVDNDIHLLHKLHALAKRNNCDERVHTFPIDMETKTALVPSKPKQENDSNEPKEKESKKETHNNEKEKEKAEETVKAWKDSALKNEQFHLVHVARYLYREMFDILRDLILPGGFIVYHTFTAGVEAFGKPRRGRFILQKDELKKVFGPPLFDVIHHGEMSIEDGRPVQFIVARKK